MKTRIDKLLVERGLVASRERAQALILAGRVLVNGQKLEKSGSSVEADADIRLLGEDLRYVSRGGLKLEAALDHWKVKLDGLICVDVGASTGGFTDCMLQQAGAIEPVSFIALDVSFISVTLVLPAVLRSVFFGPRSTNREMITLIKPQFEAGREAIGKGGIVRDEHAQQSAIMKIRETVEKIGGRNLEVIEST